MALKHAFEAVRYEDQLRAVSTEESRVMVIKDPSGSIQKVDGLSFGPDATELDLVDRSEFVVTRVWPGTKDNGIMPGFSVVEVFNG